MTNLEKYRQAFVDAFEIEPEQAEGYVFRQSEGWDSIGHMSLVAALEDAFGLELEPDEMLAITSFPDGMEMLKHKGIEF